LMVLLGWCFSQPVENTPPTLETGNTLALETGNVVSTGAMSGDSNMSWTINSWTLQNIQPTKDSVWTVIPKDKDIWAYLSEYLAWEWLSNKVIGKKLVRNDIIAISMGDVSVQWRCADYMSTDCINFILKDRKIIYSNFKSLIEKTNPWDGEVYRFTKNWILFSFWWGEWAACQWGSADRFTYVNLDSLKSFYSVLSRQDKWISPDPKDNMCENKNTKRTKTEILRFYQSNNDWNNEKKALPIQAKTTEEAFYKYYKLPQPKN